MKARLAGRTALVTGASRGIGLAIATALAGAEARVLLLSRDAGRLAELAESLGAGAVAIPCDLGVSADVDSAIARIVAVAGVPDVLVSNAGAFLLGLVGAMPPDEMDQMLHLNLGAPHRLLHAFVPAMRERRSGDVVTIGSVADRATYPENAGYAATKFGARAMHQVLREELRGSGVRASLISPGPVDTHIWDPIRPETRVGYPTRDQMLRPEDVAEAVLWTVTQPPHVNVDELRLSRS
jgi:NADP-dependent 3-hydroxy acid dehydrogenase YdfG